MLCMSSAGEGLHPRTSFSFENFHGDITQDLPCILDHFAAFLNLTFSNNVIFPDSSLNWVKFSLNSLGYNHTCECLRDSYISITWKLVFMIA